MNILPPPDGYPTEEVFLGSRVLVVTNQKYERLREKFMGPLLFQYGVVFRRMVYRIDLPPGTMGECFESALRAAITFGLIYCEGMLRIMDASGNETIMAHAWCALEDGRIADTVFPQGPMSSTVTYHGIMFNTSYVVRQARANGFFGLLAGHPVKGDTVGPFVDPSSDWLHPACMGTGHFEKAHSPCSITA
jgi:hypothetical protein